MLLRDLVNRRIKDVETAFGLSFPVTWDVGPWPHFNKPRGFGVTFQDEHGGPCKMRFSTKLETAPDHRKDGIVRHELGHVVDLLVNPAFMDAWSLKRGVRLPPVDKGELRADAIAHAVWNSPLLYDKDTVQSTLLGIPVRPPHLGV
jgi:hypothetical protein